MEQQGAQVIVIDGFLDEMKRGIHGVERTLGNVVPTSMEIRGNGILYTYVLLVRRENRRMACIATVFGSGLGGWVSVSDRNSDGKSCISVQYVPQSLPQTMLHTPILSS